MKQSIISTLIAILSLVACKKNVDNANNSHGTNSIISEASVPSAVISTFNANFSSSTQREWRNGTDDNFICQFNMDDERQEVQFDDHGHQSSHAVICLDAAVPAIVLNAFNSNFPTDIVDEFNLTNENTWKAHFMRGSVKWEVTFNEAGSIVKSEHD